MKNAIPGTTIEAEPHIKSTLHTWKRQYGLLSGLLAKSGVNWNSITKKVVCTQESWDEASKAYEVVRNKKDDAWPFYEDWLEIFGKDRATGDNSTDFVEAVNEVLNNIGNPYDNPPGMADEEFLDSGKPKTVETSSFHDAASGSGATPKTNKRKTHMGGEDCFVEVVSILADKTDDALVELVKSMATDKDDKTARQAVYEALGVFPELTILEKVTIGKKLAKGHEELDFFFSLPHEARRVFVTQMK